MDRMGHISVLATHEILETNLMRLKDYVLWTETFDLISS